MKKTFLLLLPTVFLAVSCGENKKPDNPVTPEPKIICPDGKHTDVDKDYICDVCGFPIEHTVATSVSGDPSASFYLKVGETKNLKATLSPTPERDLEKTFTWKNSSTYCAKLDVDEKDTNKATVTGLKPGTAKFTATNDYNPSLYRDFNANIIEFDSENMYLWEYQSADRAKFGYENIDGKKQGTPEGVANLNGLDWNYYRSETTSLQSNSGAIGFGKGNEPEKTVRLTNHNDRLIDKIVVETWSSKGLANLTIKVGENTVLDQKTGKENSLISTNDLEHLAGDISIEFNTPEYDPSRVEDPEYMAPGAVYLKSILITYQPIQFKTIKSYDFIDMYSNPDRHELDSLENDKSFTLEDEDFSINFSKVTKESRNSIEEHLNTNGTIKIDVKKDTEVAKYVEFKYVLGKNSNTYSIYSSIFGGEPFTKKVAEGKEEIKGIIQDKYANSILISPSGTNYIGLVSISIKTIEGKHVVMDKISYKEDAKPAKTNYLTGETFNSDGLGNLLVSFTDKDIPEYEVSNDYVNFYDAASYDNPSDHSGKQETLQEGTTEVVAVFCNLETRINGLTVETKLITLNRVNSVSDLTNGKYLFVIPSVKKYWAGSMTSTALKGTGSIVDLGDIEIGETISVSETLSKEAFAISATADSYNISKGDGAKVGMTEKFGFSIAAAPKYSNWTVSFIDNFVDFSISVTDGTVKHLGFDSAASKMNVLNASSNNLTIYRIAD